MLSRRRPRPIPRDLSTAVGSSPTITSHRQTTSCGYGSRPAPGRHWLLGGQVSTHPQHRYEFLLVAFVAIAAAAVRFSTPSLESICSRCLSTVRGLKPKICAMSRLVLPLLSQASTSPSRVVRPSSLVNSGGGAVPDSLESRSRNSFGAVSPM